MATKLGPIKLKDDLRGQVGATIMFGFALISFWRWHSSALIFYALLGLRDLLASWFLFRRRPASAKSKRQMDYLAYLSSALPFGYWDAQGTSVGMVLLGSILAIIGFTIASLALLDLGTSFGVAPANRGRVDGGLYRFLRHPMYMGYVLAECGLVLVNHLNVFIFVISCGLYFLRAKDEEKVLCGVD